jgi:hypothetical protein
MGPVGPPPDSFSFEDPAGDVQTCTRIGLTLTYSCTTPISADAPSGTAALLQ